jgi:hypothetical protein
VHDSDSARVTVVRHALLHTALGALDQLIELPVARSVKVLFCDVFRSVASPPVRGARWFRPDLDHTARGLCAFALLQRFPAGQFDWELSGLPRSWLLKIPARDLPRVIHAIGGRLKGFRPCFFAHMGLRRYSLVFRESESNRSYYRMAKSMEQQPDIRGLLASAWFFAPDIGEVSPHLAWTLRTPQENGAIVTTMGPADVQSGFLEGSRERRERFERGEYSPMLGLLIWPREDLIRWAGAHPELEDEPTKGAQ